MDQANSFDSQRLVSQRFNLTTGGILAKLLQVSVPIVGTQLLLMSYNLVDMLLLGRLSPDAVAASGSAGMYLWLAGGVQIVGRMGAEIGVAQLKGKGDREGAREYSFNSLFLAVVLGVAMALAYALFAPALISFLNIQESHVRGDAADYLRIVAAGVPASFIAASVAGTFTGAGNSRAPFIVMAIGLAINIVLDPIFIFTLGMGVRGAAVATVIGQTAACAVAVLWLLRKRDRPFRHYPLGRKPSRGRIRQILAWSLPVGVESLLFTFFSMIVARYIAHYGASAFAVYRVGSHIESLCWLVCLGFSSGVTAFVGQNCGAGRWTRIWECFRKATAFLVAWGVLVTVVFLVWGERIFHVIVPDELISRMGGRYLWILAFCQVFFCLESVAAGAFRGLGRTAPPSVASASTNALRVALVALFVDGRLGLEGIWWAITFTASLRGLWIFLWFLRHARSRKTGPAGPVP